MSAGGGGGGGRRRRRRRRIRGGGRRRRRVPIAASYPIRPCRSSLYPRWHGSKSEK